MGTRHQPKEILARWPSRRAIAEDSGADLTAVHQWFIRDRIPAEYDLYLVTGGERRGIRVTFKELAEARAKSISDLSQSHRLSKEAS